MSRANAENRKYTRKSKNIKPEYKMKSSQFCKETSNTQWAFNLRRHSDAAKIGVHFLVGGALHRRYV